MKQPGKSGETGKQNKDEVTIRLFYVACVIGLCLNMAIAVGFLAAHVWAHDPRLGTNHTHNNLESYNTYKVGVRPKRSAGVGSATINGRTIFRGKGSYPSLAGVNNET
ncbi:MAG: hypothetical protein ACRCYD_12240, partial [Plesiomonas sp.]